MEPFPPTVAVGELDGHLWLRELIDGAPLRFRLRESGAVEFAGESAADPPPQYEHATGHVRRHLDRTALRAAVPEVGAVTLYGVATQRRAVAYDWDRLPPFLGTDVRSGERGSYLPPDRVDQVFEGLGLRAANAVEKELPSRDFDPGTYAFPASAWYDGPAAGVVVRDKSAGRAVLANPAVDRGGADPPPPESAREAARAYATDARLDALADRLRAAGTAVTVDALTTRTYRALLREHHHRLLEDGAGLDPAELRSALAGRVAEHLG